MTTINVCHVFLLFLLHLAFLTSAQSNSNITMRSPLSSLKKNSYWTSPSGEFAFGFYPYRDLVLLAIWFDKIPPKTIIWTGNDGKPVEKGATVQLTSNGILSLQSQDGTEIWKTQPTNTAEVSYGALLDTGNLVLISTNSTVLWASFDSPTDTILPSQILNSGSLLSSRATEMAYNKGRFQFTVQADGNLVLNSMARPTDDKYIAYWASHTWMQGTQLVFNQSTGSVYQILRNATSRFYLSADSPKSTALYYQRVTLDVDGVLRKYTYPKESGDHGKWSISWSVPENICAADFGQLGSGLCGFNSYCRLATDQKPACDCPPGYTYFDPENTFKGCKPDFVAQICGETSDGFEILEISNIDWPSNEYEYIKSQSADWCSKTCLKDCLCAAAVIVNGTECLMKKFPLSNGRLDPDFNGKTLVKVGKEKSRSAVGCGKEKKWILPVVTVLGICIILVLVLLTLALYFGHYKKDGESKKVTHTSGVKSVG